MSHHEFLDRMDDFVDGALSSEEARRFEEHLAQCAECREELNRLGALLDQATVLRDRPIAPARDLWPGIREKLPVGREAAPGHAGSEHAARGGDGTSAAIPARWSRPRQWIAAVSSGFARRPLVWSAAAIVLVAGLYIAFSHGALPGGNGTGLSAGKQTTGNGG